MLFFLFHFISEKRQIDVHFCLIAFFICMLLFFFVSLQSANNYRLRINSAQFNFRPAEKKGLLPLHALTKSTHATKPIENKLNQKHTQHNKKKHTATLQTVFICRMMSLNRKSDFCKLMCVHL